MLKTTIEEIDGKSKVILDGIVDEHFDLDSIIPQLKPETHFYCNRIKRLNSTGIKKWILFFSSLRNVKIKFELHEVSPALVEQLNLISNFAADGPVRSVTLPYRCQNCGKDSQIIMTKGQMSDDEVESPVSPCPHCQKQSLEFDDIASDYLQFWR